MSRLSTASCILFSQGSQDQFELLWFREIRHVQLSLGQSAGTQLSEGKPLKQGQKFIDIDEKKAHFNVKCGEEEWVEPLDEFKKFGKPS